jgi:hypothetical protein
MSRPVIRLNRPRFAFCAKTPFENGDQAAPLGACWRITPAFGKRQISGNKRESRWSLPDGAACAMMA